eukprot:COSAG01_NODE_10572_length_2130_cov_2.862137_3_plen_150_part_01
MFRAHVDTQTQEVDQQIISLVSEPQIMHYLITDIYEKLTFLTKKERSSFLGSAAAVGINPVLSKLDVKSALTTLLPVLCVLRHHLEGVGNALKRTIAEQQDEQLGLHWSSESIVLILKCVALVLRCPDLQNTPDNRTLLCRILRSFRDKH